MLVNPKVSIIIPNWNEKYILLKCISSIIKKTNYKNYKIVLVDNGSDDGGPELVEKKFKYVKIIRLKNNYGYPNGINIGIRYALENYKPEYIALINNDIEVINHNWLKSIIDYFQKNDNIGIIGCKLIYHDGRIQHRGMKWKGISLKHRDNGEIDSKKLNLIEEVVAVSGASMVLKSRMIKEIGLLDEVYSPFNFEDLDYCLRARKNGYKIITYGKTRLIHHESISIKKIEEKNRFFIIKRNELIFILRWWKEIPNKLFLPLGLLKIISGCFFKKNNKIIFRKNFYRYIMLLIKATNDALKYYKIRIDRI